VTVKGTVVIDGRSFPIRDLRLVGGSLEVEFPISGPQPSFVGPVTVYGEDGQGCWQGNDWSFEDAFVPDGATWICHYRLTLYQVRPAPSGIMKPPG